MYSSEYDQSEQEPMKRNGYEPIAQISSAKTPPTYVVRETSDGRLVNDSFGVEWPQRPPYGRYAESKEEIVSSRPKQRRKHCCHGQREADKEHDDESFVDEHRPNTRERRRKSICDHSSEASIEDETRKCAEKDDYLFVGAQTMSTVSKLLRPNDFRLYYQTPSSNENTIPIRIPLCLAYMSAAGKVYHFPIVCVKDEETGKEVWRVLYGDPRPTSFATLSALVKYHKIYSYMDPKTGAIDTFPVWKGTVIDCDDYD